MVLIEKKNLCEWKSFPKNMNNNLHTICSYMAMFPPSLPHYFIDRYSSKNDIVLDPFSGRGTTILEACFMGRIGIGNDKNPLAYVLTKAKANVPQKGRIISRISQLQKEYQYENINLDNESENIRMIFSDYTLKQLLFIRNELNWRKSNVDAFIVAMVLGIIHGSSEGYLSIRMPNTFSMSPNYVKKFISEHNLEKSNRDVFLILRKKLERCYQKPPKSGKAYHQDARNMTKIKKSSVDLIITSPPYTRVIRSGKFNWIRLWFLDYDGKEVDQKLFFSESISKYSVFMSEALIEMKRVLKPRGNAVLVIGDVKDRESNKRFNLAKIIWKKCAQPLGFKLLEPIMIDKISDDTKVSKIWGEKRGDATKIDRILILEK
jgi:site-specific DNA-methyltransferase (adenine-specific)